MIKIISLIREYIDAKLSKKICDLEKDNTSKYNEIKSVLVRNVNVNIESLSDIKLNDLHEIGRLCNCIESNEKMVTIIFKKFKVK